MLKGCISLNIVAVVPSLDPDEKLITVLEGLVANGFTDIVMVNDGSKDDSYFKIAEERYGCVVLTHEVNKGKGRALKTAFTYILEHFSSVDGVVTLDGDNQHTAKDIVNVSSYIAKNPDSVVLGVRDFSSKDVPFRSRFGNKTTALLFKLCCAQDIPDTQTGLRGIPLKFLPFLIELEGERFEYETNMLLSIPRMKATSVCVPIETVYLNENETSHFRPLKDSYMIMRTLIKFYAVSVTSMMVDLGLYYLLFYLLGLFSELTVYNRILWATVVSRLCSAVVNYTLNRKLVFKYPGSVKRSVVQYALLVAIIMFLSYLGVSLLTFIFGFSFVLFKPMVDVALSVLSFKIQKEYIFKE